MGDTKSTAHRIGAGRETASPGDIVAGDTFIGRVRRIGGGFDTMVELDDGRYEYARPADHLTIVQRFTGPASAVQKYGDGAWHLSKAHMTAVRS